MATNIPGYLIHCGIATAWLLVLLLMAWFYSKIVGSPTFFEKIKSGFFVFWSFSLLGLTVGLLSGSSLSPVIGNIIPSLLTFFGLIVIYQFSTERINDANKNTISCCILLNCIFMLYGIEVSSQFRLKFEDTKRNIELNLNKELETHKNNLQIELKRQEFKLDSMMKLIESSLNKDKGR